ncbi:hypothetical protein STENM327S_09374 [Streptomyces tendae]
MSEPRSAPTVGQVVLGRRLLDLRERAGLKREEAARILARRPGHDPPHGDGRRPPSRSRTSSSCWKPYGVGDEEADAFVRLAEDANKPGGGGSASTTSSPAGSGRTSAWRARPP